MDGLIVDSFAGGGGASLGIAWALGRSPDIAINHNQYALSLHAKIRHEYRVLNAADYVERQRIASVCF